MTGIIAMAVLSSAAFANTIVPETSRDGKTKNASVIATTGEMRTFVAGEYNSTDLETDTTPANKDEVTNMNLYGAWSNKMFSVEADLNMADDNDTDVNTYGVQAAYRINKQFGLGLGYTMEDTDPNSEDSTIEIAGSYNMNDLVIGASFAIVSEDNGTTDGSHNRLTLGVGSNANNMSWEAGLVFDLEEKDDDITSASRTKLFAGATKVINNIEFDGDITYTTGDNTVAGGDYTKYTIDFDAEFLVGKMFYITPGLAYSNEDADGAETTKFDLSADFGYRANKIDATFGIDYTVAGESSNVDFDGMAWKVNVAYLF
ncbi:hypothetical protein ACRXCV_15130 [Halobacteriovorax sp. GFR7]|uniref:hypothetical protein n=1 Tax=unclassified Halobacteriovorax TaxID=2639665 RepID=UPI003D957FA9